MSPLVPLNFPFAYSSCKEETINSFPPPKEPGETGGNIF